MRQPDTRLRSLEELRRTTAPRAAGRARAQRDPTRSLSAPRSSASIASGRGRNTRELVARAAKGLAALGLKAGDRIAIMADACEEWLICDLAAQSLGAIVYGIYPTASAEEVEYQMRDGGAVHLRRRGPGVRRQDPAARRSPAGAAPHRGGRRDGAVRAGARQADRPSGEVCEARPRCRSRLARGARSPRCKPEQPAFIVYTSGTTGPSQGRAGRARQASGRDALGGGALSDADRQAAPHGRLPAALPRARPRHRRHAAADDGAGAALRRERRGPADDAVRDGADGAVHGAALPAEVGLADAGRHRQHIGPQALRLRPRDALCAGRTCKRRWAGATSDGVPDARMRLWRAARVPADPQQARLRPARAGRLRRRAAAGRDHGAVAHAGRQRRRDVRPDRDGGRHHRRPARAVPAAGRRRHGARRLRGEAGRRRRDPGALAGPVRRLLGQRQKRPKPCSATTAGCAPATSANGATAASS